MSEFFLCEIENIEKSGVEIKVTGTRFKKDDDDDCIRTVRTVCFDFTKHDKVFEDKIAELENIINHKLGGWDKHGITYQEILDMKAENQELKQCIAEFESKNNQLTESILRKETKIHELESKEVEKPTKLNLNDRIKVKLTPLGAEIYYHQYDEVNKRIKENGGTELEPIMPQIDKDRYTEFQLWHFVELYGEHIGMCKKNVIDPLDIIISE